MVERLVGLHHQVLIGAAYLLDEHAPAANAVISSE
jgi:hypothetical protein